MAKRPTGKVRPTQEDFASSIIFDFLGTMVYEDWINYKKFIDTIIHDSKNPNELDNRIIYVGWEKDQLSSVLEKLGYAEKNQLNENEDEDEFGDDKPVDVDGKPTDTLNDLNTNRKECKFKGTNFNSPCPGDAGSADYIEKTRQLWIPNMKWRRGDLNYKIKKIFDLIWQYERELFFLDLIKNSWDVVKQQIENNFQEPEWHELRLERDDPDSTGWIKQYSPTYVPSEEEEKFVTEEKK